MKITGASKIALTAWLAVSLAGCSGGAGTTAGNGNSAAPEGESQSTYTYTGSGPVTDQKDARLSILATNAWTTNVDLSTAAIVKQVESNAGVSVDWDLIPPQNYADAVSPRLAAGMDLPDIVYLPDQDQLMKYIKSGLFLSLDELYDKYGVNLKKIYEKSPAIKASLTTPDGKMYYVPQQTLTRNYMPLFMINQRWLSKLKLQEPTTLDEFTEMLRKFKSEDPNGNGKADEIPLSMEAKFVPMAFGPAFGLDLSNNFYADDQGKVHFSYYEPAYKDYLTYLNGLYKEGLLTVDYASTTADQVTSRISQDVTGATFNFSWYQSMVYSPLFADYDPSEPIFKGIPPLKGPYGDAFYIGRTPVSGIFGISKNSKNPELAFKFLDYGVSEEAQTLYTWGIKDDTYTEQNGVKTFTENGKNNEYIQKLGIGPVNLPNIQSTDAADATVAPWHAKLDKEFEQYVREPFPFVYALSDEASIESTTMPDVTTYVQEMNFKFISGEAPLDKFDSYIQTLKSMNIDQVIAGRQAQYDRYMAAQK
ncbi:extracellular solute-binding protein [Paenibacillus sp. SYP-B4298]|uniref:extracellular solute-binding protein n=1 Tax=Paenibacillus sp. SYP-B4298 TaxID=2996034 RepID=UPI0022DDA788|nr:extracellular solute-binding protein [Paenibacillus sp. SYP-B4298]